MTAITGSRFSFSASALIESRPIVSELLHAEIPDFSLEHYPIEYLVDYLLTRDFKERLELIKKSPINFLFYVHEKNPECMRELANTPFWQRELGKAYIQLVEYDEHLVRFLVANSTIPTPLLSSCVNLFLGALLDRASPNMDKVRLAVSLGAKLENYAITSLFGFSGMPFQNLMRLFVEHHLITLDGKDRHGIPFFHLLVKRDEIALVREWIEMGVDLELCSEEGVRALHVAAGSSHLKMVQLLIEKGAAVNAATLSGITPLHLSALNGNLPITQALVYAGADPNTLDADLLSPFHCAYFNMRPFALGSFLFEHGANPMVSEEAFYDLTQIGFFDKKTISQTVRARKKDQSLRIMNAHTHHLGGISVALEGEGGSTTFLEGFFAQAFLKPLIKVLSETDGGRQVAPHFSAIRDFGRSDAEILGQIQRGEMTLIPSGYTGHASMLVFFDQTVAICDTNQQNPILFCDFDPEELDLEDIADIREAKQRNVLHQRVALRPSESKKVLEEESPIQNQVVGNCSWACIEAALYVVLMVEATKHLSDPDAIREKIAETKPVFREILLQMQIRLLDKYLRLHELARSPYSPDFALLEKLQKNLEGKEGSQIGSLLSRVKHLTIAHPQLTAFQEEMADFLEDMKEFYSDAEFDLERFHQNPPDNKITYHQLFQKYCNFWS
ncbi:MAG: ankyrin repeat domain-containing protein [Verrucomicrobia bacterium]|nr:ankyrin repeat domain-containing protein [Verrucomicrobiota bacterium]